MRASRNFRPALSALAIGLVLFSADAARSAEQFPNRPITLICNFGAGGQTDVEARLLAKVAEKKLGVPVIISNRAGGGGAVGVTELARSKPDGYTIGTLTIAATSVLPMMQKVAYQPFKDFDYISGYGRFLYGIFTKMDSPFKTIKDVVDEARRNPGKINFGTFSYGSALGLTYVEVKEGVKMTFISMQGGQEAASSLVGGHIQLSIQAPDSIMQFVENKEVRPLAAISSERWPFLPNVPTMKELGYDIDITGWKALGAPLAGVPKDRLAVLFNAFKAACADPEVNAVREKFMGNSPYISGEEVKKIYERRAVEWKPLIENIMKSKSASK